MPAWLPRLAATRAVARARYRLRVAWRPSAPRGGLGMQSGDRRGPGVPETVGLQPSWGSDNPTASSKAKSTAHNNQEIIAAVVSRSKGNSARPTVSAGTRGVVHYGQGMPTAVVSRSIGSGGRPTMPARTKRAWTTATERCPPRQFRNRKKSVKDQQDPPTEEDTITTSEMTNNIHQGQGLTSQ